jgi:hypothetical protein
MKRFGLRLSLFLATFLMVTVASTAVADKLPWADGGKGGKAKQKDLKNGYDGEKEREYGGSHERFEHDGEMHDYSNHDRRDFIQNYLMPLMI